MPPRTKWAQQKQRSPGVAHPGLSAAAQTDLPLTLSRQNSLLWLDLCELHTAPMMGLDWLRRETTDDPEEPWAAEAEQQDGGAEQAALKAQEDYEYHIALALSQSANDANLALAKQEADDLADSTRRSLGPPSTGRADSLSYKLWDSDWWAWPPRSTLGVA